MMTTQQVTAALRKAGFQAASDKWGTPGYNARRTRGRKAVCVFTSLGSEATLDDYMAHSERMAEALGAAGFQVTRPYPAPEALCVTRGA